MKQTLRSKFILLLAVVLLPIAACAQTLFYNDITDSSPQTANPYTSGQGTVANLTASGIGRGSGITGNSGSGRYNATGWTPSATALVADEYFEFILTPENGYGINFTSLQLTTQRSNTGPTTGDLRSSLNNYATSIGTFTFNSSASSTTISLAGSQFQGVTGPITFRIFGYGTPSNGASGTASINDFLFSGTVTAATLAAPVATAATNITSNSFTANWNTVTGATSYRIDVSTDMAFTNILETYDDWGTAGQSLNINLNISPGTTYYYRIRAVSSTQTSANSNIIQVTTLCTTPAPTAPEEQLFCGSGTIAGLTATGTGIKWYAAPTGGSPLSGNTPVVIGNYYASQTVDGCESSRTVSEVSILPIPMAPLAGAQEFCYGATVGQLIVTSGTGIKWYASETAVTPLASTDMLATGTYYATQTLNSCESATRTAVTVTVNMTPAPAASAQTFCNTATVAELTATGTGIKWYASETAVTPLASTDMLATGTYYATQTLNSCESAIRTAVTVTVNMTPAPAASAQTFCNAATVAELTATGTGIKWYASETAVTPLASTDMLATGTYYATQTLNSCESATRTAVTVTVNMTPAPTASAQTFCNTATVAELTATSTGIKWYASETAVTPLASTDMLATGTYYATQTLNSCESATRTAVTVTVNMTPAPAASAQTFCNTATVAELTATGTGIKWYASETAVTPLASTDMLATGTYYATQTLNSCESATRTAVTVTVNMTPAPVASVQTFCNTATVAELTATGTGIKWYASETAVTPLASTDVLATGTYYATQTLNGCESAARTAVTVTVNTTPAPTASALTFCNAATVADLAATGTGIKWYASETAVTPLASTDMLATGTYYATQTLNGCESATRTAITVTVNMTPAPVASAQTFCNTATVAELTATGTGIKWYASETAITPLASTDMLATGTYYATQTLNGCESATRTAVMVTVNMTPAPVASAQTFCNTATVAELTATGTGIKWYMSETAVTPLASTDMLATGTYYATQTLNSCESATRTAVMVTVNMTPAPAASAQTFCNTATVAELTATGTGIKWYMSETAVTPLALTDMLATGTYYATQTLNGCESATRTAVTVTVNTTPAPVASAQTFCNTATVADLAATGTGIKWYISETAVTPLASTDVLATGTYYATQTLNGCESATRTAVAVTVNMTPAPAASAQTFCNTATVAELTATGTGIKWYASETAVTPLASTDMLATGTYYATQTLNSCESATRTAVAVTVNTTPAPAASAQTFCNTATVADLAATGTGIKWYMSETAVTPLALTDMLATGTYYATQTLNSCESATRTAVAVTVNITPAPASSAQTFCNTATVAELAAIGTGIKWYASETAITPLASTDMLATGTYYATQTVNSCESATRTAVTVTVNMTPAPIIANTITLCGPSTVSNFGTGASIKWYSSATGATPLAATDALAAGLSIYFASQVVDGCESLLRTPVAVLVNITSAPAASAQTFCNTATVAELTATGTGIKWYMSETAVTPLASTNMLATGTYYATQTLNSCESATRTAVMVTVNMTPAPTASAQTFCNTATVAELTATGTGIKWYASETAVAPLASTDMLATGTYYATQTLNSCESAIRTAVTVTVISIAQPTGNATQTFTAGETLADLEVTGTSIIWYADAALTVALPSNTPLTDNTTYYAVNAAGNCTSSVALAVTVDEVLGVTTHESAKISYYPNPVVDIFTLSNVSVIETVTIYNLLGQPVKTTSPNSNLVKMDLSQLSAGTYLVQAVTEGKSQIIKIVKN